MHVMTQLRLAAAQKEATKEERVKLCSSHAQACAV